MKPTFKKFEKAVSKYGGNLTKVAESFGVSRTCMYKWVNDDPKFKEVVEDARMRLFDECLSTARIVAAGIPNVVNGKIVGWDERPDSNMLRYLLGSLGKKEGFGESIDVTTGGEKIGINMFRVLTKDEMKNFDKKFDEDY